MAKQTFTATQREAIWRAHYRKCPYTCELLDISTFHIDHIIPEKFKNKPDELTKILKELNLPLDFNLLDWENLLPCHPKANLQKSQAEFEPKNARFYLDLAEKKKKKVIENINKITNQINRSRARIQLQQFLEHGRISTDEVEKIVKQHAEANAAYLNNIQDLEPKDDCNFSFNYSNHNHKENNNKSQDFFTENALRHRDLFVNTRELENFQIFYNPSTEEYFLKGFGLFDIFIKDCHIDVQFNIKAHMNMPAANFEYVTTEHIPVYDFIYHVAHSIGHDETINYFNFIFDFRADHPEEMFFTIKKSTYHIKPDIKYIFSNSVYLIECDRLTDTDNNTRIPLSRELIYLKILESSYKIYRKIRQQSKFIL
ncbi:HNH endonuclease [Pantoea ananatis]|uniref:HNH endonuclease n=1 Tax=Pantoea ananas TaxID=553 RepID=UPI000F878D54|nr:HNH endonuclease signature motif containing protein [Pantoea ananatis]RQN06643.1 HNH endonuclease [Pantoea ananatis]